MKTFPLLAAGLICAALPALADMTPAEDSMISALSACSVSLGAAPAMDAALAGLGWTKGETADGETAYDAPKGDEGTVAYVAEDGSFCSVVSSTLTIAQGQTMAQAVLEQVGVKQEDVAPAEDDYGCKGLKLASGETVSVVSGDETPVCEGGTGVMVTFGK